MPFSSKKQERFFQAIAHSPKFAAKVHVSQKVAKKMIKHATGKKKK